MAMLPSHIPNDFSVANFLFSIKAPFMQLNTIYLRRRQKVIIPYLVSEQELLEITYISAILKDMAQLGYTFSPTLINHLQQLTVADLTAFYKELVAEVKTMLGDTIDYKPMYPNFPKQVMDMKESTLYVNAIVHYVAKALGTRWLPKYEKKERAVLADDIKLTIIDLGSEKELKELGKSLLAAKTSLSVTDKEDITFLIQSYKSFVTELLPESLPHKENLAFIVRTVSENTDLSPTYFAKYIKTATDVLRLAVAFSDGDVSLAAKTKFKKFKRIERRLLLGLLENCTNLLEDMVRYQKPWIRLGEILHPGEYKNRFPNTFKAFDTLRNATKRIPVFNTTIEKALADKQVDEAIKTLVTRPGELARRLDHLVRIAEQPTLVTQAFSTVSQKVSTPVLLQVYKHFKHRNEDKELRAFFPKGQVAKVQTIPNELPDIAVTTCKTIMSICKKALVERFKSLPPLGKVYLSKELKNYIVPFSQRSASKALRTVVRGSQLPLPTIGNTLRFFLWWKEGVVNGEPTGEVDIDLSAVMYTEKWEYIEHISYTNLKSEKYKAVHSGDLTSAPDGAAEFIDLDMPSILEYGGRYVVMALYAYSAHPYCDLPECYAGWMMRQFPESGEIFEPATVQDKIDLTANTQVCLPVILDLVAQKVIWIDLALTSFPHWPNNVENNNTGMVAMGKAMTTLVKPNLYELFQFHVKARGELTDNIATAQTIFATDKGITPFHTETIMSDFL